jgi:NAD(P)-dependent dehydrogenase (short-subunit alcohol dehydrogenase family)
VGISTAIVTGAGSGIGRAIALRLKARGWNVALVGRRAKSLEETESLMHEGREDEGDIVLPADVSRESEVRRLVQQVRAHWKSIDALVNNAGVAPLLPIEATTMETLEEVFGPNTFGPALLISAVLPIFKEQSRGTVVNISSLAARDPFPGFFVYAASKAALESLIRSIRNEVPSVTAFNVRVGAADTEMIRRIFTKDQLAGFALLSPDRVARIVVDCIEGKADLAEGTIEITA